MNCGINIVAARTTHQNEELKDASRKFNRVYAFRVSRVNADYVCLKLWLLGGVIRARNIAVAALPDLIAQIDAALADGCEVIALDGAEFSAPEKVLSGIKKEFSSYCCIGGVSDAKNVHGAGKAALPQSESLRSTKPKASAPQGSASAARHFDSSTETGEAAFIAQSAPQAESASGADASAVADGLIQAFREALRAELAPIRAVLDALSFKVEELTVFAKGNSALEPPESSFPRTRRGRTSVVVGVRKVSTPKKQK